MMRTEPKVRRMRGVTLIEVIVAMTVISICVTAVLGLLSAIAVRSAGAVAGTQAQSVAMAYLDEILSKAYQDPNGVSESGRQNFDDVLDYNGLDETGATDCTNTEITGLGLYRVRVTVSTVQFGSPAPKAVSARRIDVRVTDPTGVTILLSGYRTSYTGQVMRW
jgi:MSHA pilin protein MshD